MKRILAALILLFTILPTTAWGYVYNEPHTFQSQLETARSKTVRVVLENVERYPWATFYSLVTAATGTMIGDGYILTNHHVIDFTHNEIDIALYDGTITTATLIKSDKDKDLALLHIDSTAEGFIFSTTEPYTGQSIMTVGQPTGLPQWSFSEGVIQSIDQPATMTTGESYTAIMTDAEVKQGNSGGPLLNERGELVGIVRAANVGHSFAVTLEDVKKFLEGI